MGWYDFFSGFYDRSMERLYRGARLETARALSLQPGETCLDLPCGTGLSFDELAPAVVPSGRVVGLDRSPGMLKRAAARAAGRGWAHVVTRECDVTTLEPATLGELVPPGGFDVAHVFLGLTAFPDWEASFERIWALVRPGGRMAVVDCHADPLTFQGRMVNLVARADIRRRVWEPLEKVAAGYTRRDLPSLKDHGGQLFLALGRKPT